MDEVLLESIRSTSLDNVSSLEESEARYMESKQSTRSKNRIEAKHAPPVIPRCECAEIYGVDTVDSE